MRYPYNSSKTVVALLFLFKAVKNILKQKSLKELALSNFS